MSRFFSEKYKGLKPYVPGEQPRDKRYIKLNTNESPFPPSPRAQQYAAEIVKNLQLYSDPDCTAITQQAAELFQVKPSQIFFGNGSDEVLYLSFLAFCDEKTPAYFPDITYGFYKVYAEFLGIPYRQIPLNQKFDIPVEQFFCVDGTIFVANPNAPTGKLLTLEQIEQILMYNPNHVVIVDEAYIDFGGESAIKLIDRYENLLVTQTFSKSRSLAGGRLGMAFGNEALITDLKTAKYSINPYNVNSMTMAAGLGALQDEGYTRDNCRCIIENRAYITNQLRKRDFEVLESMANFILAGHPEIAGADLYAALKERGILVRYFDSPRLQPYVRITIGTREQMDQLLVATDEILEVKL